jgi:hypothetical protein
MSKPDIWSVEDTREHISRLFGKDQLAIAKPCLSSVIDRQNYAHYHYHEAVGLLKKLVDAWPVESSVLEFFWARDEEQEYELNQTLIKIAANVLACIQSLHAIGDILAHAVYFSLGGNRAPNPIPLSKISIASVLERLDQVDKLNPVATLLSDLKEGGKFKHVDALANHGKHRSIIRPVLWGDATHTAEEIYALRIPGFRYKGTDYAEVHMRDFVRAEYERIARVVVDTGNEVNAVLSGMSTGTSLWPANP